MVHILHLDAGVFQIGGQVLRHLFGEGGDQHPLLPGRPVVDLADQIVDLALHGPHVDAGVQQSGGADDLLHDLPRPGALILPRRGRDVHHLVDPLLEFLKFQRPVVKRAGEAEAVVHQGGLAGPVPVVHGPDLGQGDMGLVDEQEKIFGEVVHQGHGGGTHGPPGDDAGVVLDAGAIAQLLHHLNVVEGALLDALGLHQHVPGLKEGHPLLQLPVDLPDGLVHLLLGGDVVAGGEDGQVLQPPDRGAGDHIDLAETVDLVAEVLDADGGILEIGGPDLYRVPPHPEHVPLKGDVVALVADLHQAPEELIPGELGAHPQGDHHLGIVVRLAQAVDAGDGGDHDDVPPLDEGGGSGETQPVDLIVGGGVLLDEGVGVGDIGLGLIVVVVADEIFHGVVREEFLEFGTELGGQRLVVGQHQGGLLDLLDDLGHGEGLAGAGDAQQGLLAQPVLDARGQGRDGLGLVPGGLIGGDHFKVRHR